MIGKTSTVSVAALLLVAWTVAVSQSTDQKRTLIINGQSTEVPVIQVNGHPYVGLQALAEAIKGSLSYSGNVVALSLPVASSESSPPAKTSGESAGGPQADRPSDPGLSREFLKAGIEQMSTLREWHTALATAIQNGIPLSAALLAPYRAEATKNLRLASVAARTASDRSAYELLNNEFQNMAKLSDKYVNMRANLTYIAPDALQNDDLNQRIIACGRSLGAMAASGQFVDEGLCH